MKKLLIFTTVAGTLFASGYFYIKKQLELALMYEYNIDNWKILKLNTEEMDVELGLILTNKSAFEIEINGYDIEIYYKGSKLIRLLSSGKFMIKAKDKFEIKTINNIVFNELKPALLPFALNLIEKKPIKLEVKGYVKCKILNLPYSVKFDNDKFEISSELLSEMGIYNKKNM